MADPMIALREIQQALNDRISFDHRKLSDGYIQMSKDFPNGGKTYSYAKIIDGEIQTLAIFGLEDPIDGVECWNVGYAVKENHRGRRLAVEAVNKGIEDLKMKFRKTNLKNFYVEAVIDLTNKHSINTAEKIFPGPGDTVIERETKTRALQFKKLVELR